MQAALKDCRACRSTKARICTDSRQGFQSSQALTLCCGPTHDGQSDVVLGQEDLWLRLIPHVGRAPGGRSLERSVWGLGACSAPIGPSSWHLRLIRRHHLCAACMRHTSVWI